MTTRTTKDIIGTLIYFICMAMFGAVTGTAISIAMGSPSATAFVRGFGL
jgi:hypothetical protein